MRLAAFLAFVPALAAAQPVVVSPGTEDVAVSIYRDNDREPGQPMQTGWANGFALITETRTISVPAGPAEIRFEGVAGTIFPQSVILSGLPGLPEEKNYDARLLTPGALVGGALGQQVSIRRTNRFTGQEVVEEAIIRAGPDDIVIQTADGFEAFRCTGLNETILFDEVPDGLSAKPTLSVRTNLPAPVTARVQLSYLASQFDWDANYVAQLAPDGESMSLFAWMTVANLNEATFDNARLLAIAGEPNREDRNPPGVDAPSIRLRCWPQDSGPPPPPPPPPPPAPAMMMDEAQDIVVTGSRVRSELMSMSPVAVVASQEDLGDLKLYRVPERVTVAANGQKQVAFLTKDEVEVERIHRFRLEAWEYDEARAGATILLRSENLKKEGLGEPLPAGNVAVFEPAGNRWEYVGEDGVDNIPVGQKLEIEVGTSPDVNVIQRALSPVEDEEGTRVRSVRYEVIVTNARPHAAEVEVQFDIWGAQSIRRPSSRLRDRDGRKAWVVTVPAQGERRFTYRWRDED